MVVLYTQGVESKQWREVRDGAGRINPNIDSIDTEVGIGIDQYRWEEIDTLIDFACVCELLFQLMVPSRKKTEWRVNNQLLL